MPKRGKLVYKIVKDMWKCDGIMAVRCPGKTKPTKRGLPSKGISFNACSYRLKERFPNYVFFHPEFKRCEYYVPKYEIRVIQTRLNEKFEHLKYEKYPLPCANSNKQCCYVHYLCNPYNQKTCQRLARLIERLGDVNDYRTCLLEMLKSPSFTEEQKRIVMEELKTLQSNRRFKSIEW